MALKKKPKKKRKYLECESCGERKPDVEKCYDPYFEDTEGREVEAQLCRDCYAECMNNI